ncbi:MAG TPA: hypothetical protein PKI66_04630 [Methanobacteriaceae archaeon]|nr:hypothetical protein [Methanobacteriaceae archaeon]
MNMSNACLTCKHRGSVPNSRHSSCRHPRVDYLMGDHESLHTLMYHMIISKRVPYLFDDLRVDFEADAIEACWALWPFNFDPLWLVNCTGYEEVVK